MLTNKYAEGYPGKRYYGGCEYVDVAERLAIKRAVELFGAEHANVQPHSGAQANAAVYHALLEPGDTMMGLELSHGGHLTHGMPINVSGRLYDIAPYHVVAETSWIDMDEVERIAHERRPHMILAGWSAYLAAVGFRSRHCRRRRARGRLRDLGHRFQEHRIHVPDGDRRRRRAVFARGVGVAAPTPTSASASPASPRCS